MPLQIARWGNSLAVRLPATLVRQAGLAAQDEVEARVTPAGELVLTPLTPIVPTTVRAGRGMLAGRAGLMREDDDGDTAALLRAVHGDDRQTHD